VAIVGSGPSGCYTAKYLLAGAASKLPGAAPLSIDVLERLPTAYGLVRNGVAPDHPEVKNVQHDFDALFETTNDDNGNKNIRFYGNVRVGGSDATPYDVSLDELRELYDVVVLAYGCESDRKLNLPIDVLENDGNNTTTKGSNIGGVLGARAFVNWYNGHPDYGWVTEEVRGALWHNKNKNDTQSIVVVGHGNVALDCARILAKSKGTLDPTDLTTRALDVLRPTTDADAAKPKRSISIVGRRGHVQAAFTIKEVRELTKLSDDGDTSRLLVRSDELSMGEGTQASQEELKARPRARIHKLLKGHASNEHEASDSATEVHLRFLTNPIRYQAQRTDNSSLDLVSVVCERTELEGDTPGQQTARGTGVTETIAADLCLVSIGYRGLPIDSATAASFDEKRGILKNDRGRVLLEDDGDNDDGQQLAPLYVSGWLKRGPSGIIGTNIGDAKETVLSILKDLEGKKPLPPSDADANVVANNASPLEALLEERKVRFVNWASYRSIEDNESSNKRHPDQPREKLVDREELLEAAEV